MYGQFIYLIFKEILSFELRIANVIESMQTPKLRSKDQFSLQKEILSYLLILHDF